jgi:hypothetical protein
MNKDEHSRLVDEARRDTLLYRIMSGKLDYGESYIKEPTRQIKEKGLRIYHEVLRDCIDVLDDRDIFIFLITTTQWSHEEEKKLEKLPKEIEESKVNYFKNYDSPSLKRQYKIELEYKKNLYRSMFVRRNKYKNLTPEGIAVGAMWFEMIRFMYKGSDKGQAINHYHNNTISEDDVRTIAQGSEWLSYYSAGKNIFGRPMVRLTEDQRKLLTWTNVYKNCHSSPDKPRDEVFKDNDAFDGWLILERRKEKISKKIEMSGVNPKAQNVYIFGNTKEDFEEINSLNSPEALRKIENEFKQ